MVSIYSPKNILRDSGDSLLQYFPSPQACLPSNSWYLVDRCCEGLLIVCSPLYQISPWHHAIFALCLFSLFFLFFGCCFLTSLCFSLPHSLTQIASLCRIRHRGRGRRLGKAVRNGVHAEGTRPKILAGEEGQSGCEY